MYSEELLAYCLPRNGFTLENVLKNLDLEIAERKQGVVRLRELCGISWVIPTDLLESQEAYDEFVWHADPSNLYLRERLWTAMRELKALKVARGRAALHLETLQERRLVVRLASGGRWAVLNQCADEPNECDVISKKAGRTKASARRR